MAAAVGSFALLTPGWVNNLQAATGPYANIKYVHTSETLKQSTSISKCGKNKQVLQSTLYLYDDNTVAWQLSDATVLPAVSVGMYSGSWFRSDVVPNNTVNIAFSGEVDYNGSTKSIGDLISTIEQTGNAVCKNKNPGATVVIVDPSFLYSATLKINKNNDKAKLTVKAKGTEITSTGLSTVGKFKYSAIGSGSFAVQ